MYMCMKTWMFVTYVYVYEDVDVCDIYVYEDVCDMYMCMKTWMFVMFVL